jgi:hypothetical protein
MASQLQEPQILYEKTFAIRGRAFQELRLVPARRLQRIGLGEGELSLGEARLDVVLGLEDIEEFAPGDGLPCGVLGQLSEDVLLGFGQQLG